MTRRWVWNQKNRRRLSRLPDGVILAAILSRFLQGELFNLQRLGLWRHLNDGALKGWLR